MTERTARIYTEMQIDGRSIPRAAVVEADICIVGAGAAGITLALRLKDSPLKVTVLESGGLEPDAETQSLGDGKATDLPYFPLSASRLRCFGGTTAHWGGLCRPLYGIDFEERSWVPYSGWPISRAQLEPYYVESQELCQIGPFDYEPDGWVLPAPPLPFPGDDLRTRLLQFSPPTRFGIRYRDELFSAPNIDVYLHSTVTSIVPSSNGKEISRLDVATLTGNQFSVRARTYVIAAGGIDNARLLLASNQVIPPGVGNDNDLVGRFFGDHINLDTAAVFPLRSDISFALYQRTRDVIRQPRRAGGRPTALMGYLELGEHVQREARTLNYSCEVNETYWSDYFMHEDRFSGSDEMFRDESRTWLTDFAEIVKTLWRNLGDATDVLFGSHTSSSDKTFYKIRTTQEQAPNPDSRVLLSTQKDRLNVPLADLQWRLSELDRHSIRIAMDKLAQGFGSAGIATLHVGIDLQADQWPTHMQGSWHHCGTTRMHADAERGVVDADCRVHGISNLYMAGSSVFPTTGNGNPTLTIIALSLRLADHLRSRAAA